jgi:type VI secretion system secreted protein Hcp
MLDDVPVAKDYVLQPQHNGRRWIMAVDFFLRIDGIEGESVDDQHKNEIEILSWSWGESQTGSATGGGGGAGKINMLDMQDFHFTMQVNKASPNLMIACATGEHVSSAKLICRKAGGQQREYMTWTLTDVLVSSYQAGGSEGNTVPVEQFSLSFAKIEFEYKPQRPDGSLDSPVKVGYDLKANKKV